MRLIFGLLSLIVVLAIVATLAKKQLSAVSEIKLPQVTGAAPGAAPLAVDPNASIQQQSQQIQQQIKQSVESSLQQARPMPEDK
jgi:hypothetical protein